MSPAESVEIRSTTVIAAVREGRIAMAADGQVTVGETVMKQTADKVRKIAQGRAVVGFAGGVADALGLVERLEAKLEAHSSNIRRAAVELARDWRTDRVLRRLEAMLLVGDSETLLVVSGNGDVIEPDDGIAAIGSGGSPTPWRRPGPWRSTSALGPEEIVEESLRIAADICIYTNDSIRQVSLP